MGKKATQLAQKEPTAADLAQVKKSTELAMREAEIRSVDGQSRIANLVVGNSQWGKHLSPDERKGWEALAQTRGLSISDGSAVVLGGNLYVTLQGRLRLAHRSGIFRGFTVDRPMTPDERELYEIPDGAKGWFCTVAIEHGDEIDTYDDWGIAGGPGEKNPFNGVRPLQMAQVRARARALKIAFPLMLQSAEEVGMIQEAEIISVEEEPPSAGVKALEEKLEKKPAENVEPSPDTEGPLAARDEAILSIAWNNLREQDVDIQKAALQTMLKEKGEDSLRVYCNIPKDDWDALISEEIAE